MAEAPVQSLDKDLAEKAVLKYSPEREAEAKAFLEQVVASATSEQPFDSSLSFAQNLRSGVILCKAMNVIIEALSASSSKTLNPIKISTSKLPFKQMENIHLFLDRMAEIRVPSFESFQTVDLYEEKNIPQVIDAIFSLSRHAEMLGYSGPRLGPKLVRKPPPRQFSADQLAQSKAAIPLLQGFTSGVSQSGMGAMGGVRQVYNPSIGVGDTSVSSKLIALAEQAPRPNSGPAGNVILGHTRQIGGVYPEQPTEASDESPTHDVLDDLLANTSLEEYEGKSGGEINLQQTAEFVHAKEE